MVHTDDMNSTTALAHRVTTTTTTSATYTANCAGCGWTGDERNSTEGAYWEGLMHEFDGNQGA